MTDFEQRCYGMTEQAIREQYIQSITAHCSGLEMVVMSILSDCQELLEITHRNGGGNSEMRSFTADKVRKQMNVAKFILSEMIDSKERV